ncbi:hypothetical protein [Bradyrhizobium brasilense]|nr:hypothetical protein [Bradyrhizobium brasilense]
MDTAVKAVVDLCRLARYGFAGKSDGRRKAPLSDTAITTLPGNLKLGGDLWVPGTSITAITASAQIGGRVCGLKPGLADAKDASSRPLSLDLAPSSEPTRQHCRRDQQRHRRPVGLVLGIGNGRSPTI